MNIIIVGCGKVGYNIAKNLSAEDDTNITIIDNKSESLNKAAESIDAMLVTGSGFSVNTLIEAGAKEADLIISVTNADETNILCCITAKHLGTKRTIARVRNPEHSLDMNKFWRNMGLDMVINPEQETAREISRLLRFPTVDGIETFAGGRVELIAFNTSEARDFFVGKSVSQVFSRSNNMSILLVTIERGDNIIVPHGDLIFENNDIIRVLGRPSNIMNFFALIGKNTEKIKNLAIIGGGRITYYLVTLLHRHSSSTDIKIIEIDKDKCDILSVDFPNCLIINGDGTDEEIISTEVLDQTQAVICLTDRDEENAVIALYSMQVGMKKVIVKINHIDQKMVKNLGLGSIVSTKNITTNQIIKYVRGLANAKSHNIRTVYKIFDNETDKVEVVEFFVEEKSKCTNIPIKDLNLIEGVLIGCIARNSNIIIPSGETHIQEGDIVIIIVKNDTILNLDHILAN